MYNSQSSYQFYEKLVSNPMFFNKSFGIILFFLAIYFGIYLSTLWKMAFSFLMLPPAFYKLLILYYNVELTPLFHVL